MSLFSRLLGKPEKGKIPYPRNSLEGMSARWLQWAASSHYNRNPILDETGEFAAMAQPNDIWFLAGCMGGSVKRRCRVPANRKIFLPILNTWMEPDSPTPNFEAMFGFLYVNGEKQALDWVYPNKLIEVKGVWGNPVTGSIFANKLYLGGLWKVLEPLPRGEHLIQFNGGDNEGFHLEVQYQITVG